MTTSDEAMELLHQKGWSIGDTAYVLKGKRHWPVFCQRDGDQIVTTNMTLPGKEDVAFLYRMHNSGGSWKIVDVFLDGYVSQVAFRRSDFASTLRSGGASALNQKLDALTDKMLATP